LDQVNIDANVITAWKRCPPSPPQPSPPRSPFSKITGAGSWEKDRYTSAERVNLQRLLRTAAKKLHDPSLDLKESTEKIAHVAAKSHTISPSQAFQTRSALEKPDLIEPADQTWTKLLAAPVKHALNVPVAVDGRQLAEFRFYLISRN